MFSLLSLFWLFRVVEVIGLGIRPGAGDVFPVVPSPLGLEGKGRLLFLGIPTRSTFSHL